MILLGRVHLGVFLRFLHLLHLFLPRLYFFVQLSSLVCLLDDPLFLHEHFDTLLLASHLLLVGDHLKSFSPFVHLKQLVSNFHAFALQGHRHLVRFIVEPAPTIRNAFAAPTCLVHTRLEELVVLHVCLRHL